MKPKDWKPKSAVEHRLYSSIQKVVKPVKFILKHKKTLEDIIKALMEFASSPEWQQHAQASAMKMVEGVAIRNARTWREAAVKSTRAHEIHMLLKNEFKHNKVFSSLIDSNSQLISSIPSSIASEVVKHIASETIAGKRNEEIIAYLQKIVPGLTENRARLIARTETAKTQAAITQVRSQALGLHYYKWETSQDQRVRSSHKHMQGVICSFDSPPNPEVLDGKKNQFGSYGPGTVPNCRCYAAVIVDPDFETFPAKIAIQGKIVSISKKKFLEL